MYEINQTMLIYFLTGQMNMSWTPSAPSHSSQMRRKLIYKVCCTFCNIFVSSNSKPRRCHNQNLEQHCIDKTSVICHRCVKWQPSNCVMSQVAKWWQPKSRITLLRWQEFCDLPSMCEVATLKLFKVWCVKLPSDEQFLGEFFVMQMISLKSSQWGPVHFFVMWSGECWQLISKFFKHVSVCDFLEIEFCDTFWKTECEFSKIL